MPEPSQVASRPPPAPDPLIGRTLGGHYRITSLLGRGGMSRVYRAVQAPLDRAVALKVLKDDPNDPTLQRRFLFEASVTSKLSHPNTITIFDYGADQGLLFFAMELLRGATMLDALKAQGRFSEVRTIHIARQICRSLREAHAHGLVHRDLKPSNFFLVDHADEQDFVKVLDFGLVKLFGSEDPQITSGGLVLGTPHYMPPEQARGMPCDQRSDIYSLGVVLYQMLTGKVPFDGRSSMDVLLQHVTEPPPRLIDSCPGLELSAEMRAVVERCMAKKPEARFQNMEDLLCALPGDRPNGSRPPPPPLDDDGIGDVLDTTPVPLRATTGKIGPAGDTRQIPGAQRASCEGVVQVQNSAPATPPAPKPAEAPKGKSSRGVWIGAAAAVAILALGGVWLRPSRAAAPPPPVAAASVVVAPTPAPAPEPVAKAAEPAPEPAPKPAEPVVKAAEPAPEPPAPETRKQPAKRERHVAAAPVKHAPASPEVLEALNERLARAVSGIRQCTMLHRSNARGEVALSVAVDPSGAVTSLRVGGGDLGTKLESCIRDAVQRVKFEPFDGPVVTLQRKISLVAQ